MKPGPFCGQDCGSASSRRWRCARFAEQAAGRGEGVVYLVEDKNVLAAFAVADAVRH